MLLITASRGVQRPRRQPKGSGRASGLCCTRLGTRSSVGYLPVAAASCLACRTTGPAARQSHFAEWRALSSPRSKPVVVVRCRVRFVGSLGRCAVSPARQPYLGWADRLVAHIQGAGGGNFCRRVAPRPGMLPGESSRSRVGARAALAGKCALRGHTLEPQLCGATCAAELGCCCHRRQVRAGAPSPAAPSRRQHCELHVAGAGILLRCAAGAAFYLLTALSHPLQGTLRRVRCCLRFRSAARAARRCDCVAGPMTRRRCAR